MITAKEAKELAEANKKTESEFMQHVENEIIKAASNDGVKVVTVRFHCFAIASNVQMKLLENGYGVDLDVFNMNLDINFR
jgi:anthranilate/para-aminobenzoate synthase component II